jgi:hypothetical protein
MNYTHWLRKNGTIATTRRSALTGKTPAELVLMAETRKLLQLLLHSKQENISPELRAAIEAMLRTRLRRTAPFRPLNDEQRIAWLDEVTHIVCRLELDDAFTTGSTYRVLCNDCPTSHIIDRQTIHGGYEEVLITGNEMLINIADDQQRIHTFCHASLPDEAGVYARHTLTTLTTHFAVPQALDITQVYPSTYAKLKAQLEAL